jgi:hypothetical protein
VVGGAASRSITSTRKPRDPHSPVTHSFFDAYAGWYRDPRFGTCNLDDIPIRAITRAALAQRLFLGAVLRRRGCCCFWGHFGLLGPDITASAAAVGALRARVPSCCMRWR